MLPSLSRLSLNEQGNTSGKNDFMKALAQRRKKIQQSQSEKPNKEIKKKKPVEQLGFTPPPPPQKKAEQPSSSTDPLPAQPQETDPELESKEAPGGVPEQAQPYGEEDWGDWESDSEDDWSPPEPEEMSEFYRDFLATKKKMEDEKRQKELDARQRQRDAEAERIAKQKRALEKRRAEREAEAAQRRAARPEGGDGLGSLEDLQNEFDV